MWGHSGPHFGLLPFKKNWEPVNGLSLVCRLVPILVQGVAKLLSFLTTQNSTHIHDKLAMKSRNNSYF